MSALLAYAFTAGTVAALSPCGLAMLPAVISRFGTRHTGRNALLDGLALGGLLTLGTITSFSVLGAIISAFGTGLAAILPYLNLALGVALLVLAVRTFAGHAVTLRLPGLRAPEGQRLSEFYPFGIAYGLASLGCTLPIFLIIVGGAATRAPVERLGLFALYGLGMGAVLIAVSVASALGIASALGKHAIIRVLRHARRYIDFIGSLGLLLAGAYLVYYQTHLIEQQLTRSATALPLIVGALALIIASSLARLVYLRQPRSV